MPSPEFQKLQQKYGVQIEQEEEEDPTEDIYSMLYGVPKKLAMLPLKRGGQEFGTDPKFTVGGLLARFYTWKPEELTKVQQGLHKQGFFPRSYYGKTPAEPTYGVADEDSFSAYRDALLQIARRQWASQLLQEEETQ